MGLNPQICLAEMDEGGDMKNGVRIQMNKLYFVEVQKTPKESIGGNRKTTIEEGFENHDLTGVSGGESFSIGGAPTDYLLLGKNPLLHHPVEMLFGDCGPLPHLLRRGEFSHWGIRARSRLSKQQKIPNQAEDGRRKSGKVAAARKT